MRNILLTIVVFLFVAAGSAQEAKDCKSIMMIKRDFIERNLVFVDNECPIFWEIYNVFLKVEAEIFENSRSFLKQNNIEPTFGKIDVSNFTDIQLYALMEDRANTKEKLLANENRLYEKLKLCLSAKTLHQYHQLEGRFRAEIKSAAKDACPHEKK